MAKRIDREFAPSDRYLYDFGACSTSRGWAQIDTAQDASYFGQWINPAERKVFCYCEGDTTLVSVDTDEELQAEVEAIRAFDVDNYPSRASRFGIDPGFSADLKAKLEAAGLGQYIH